MNHEAYHNDYRKKQDMIIRLEEHSRLDEIAQGEYWQNGKGCAITCMAYSHKEFQNNIPGGIMDIHEKVEADWGIYAPLGQVVDAIFEGLDNTDAKEWPCNFAVALEMGKNTRQFYHRLWASIIEDSEHGLAQVVAKRDHDGMQHFAYIHHRMAFGYKPDQAQMDALWKYQRRATGPIGAMAFEAAANSIWASLYRDEYSLAVRTHMRPAWQATNHAAIAIGMANSPAANWNYTRTGVVAKETLQKYFVWLVGHILRALGSPSLAAEWTDEEVENIPI